MFRTNPRLVIAALALASSVVATPAEAGPPPKSKPIPKPIYIPVPVPVPIWRSRVIVVSEPPIVVVARRRLLWQYDGGFFRDAGNGRWDETNGSGAYQFQETRRCDEFVEMVDADRGVTVRLYDTAMFLQGGTNYPVFTKFYNGRWGE